MARLANAPGEEVTEPNDGPLRQEKSQGICVSVDNVGQFEESRVLRDSILRGARW